MGRRLFKCCVWAPLLPLVALWMLAARLLALALPALFFPLTFWYTRSAAATLDVAPRGPVSLAFRYSHAVGAVYLFLTQPLRRRTPDFYLIGFPVAGTATLVRLRTHRAAHHAAACSCTPPTRLHVWTPAG